MAVKAVFFDIDGTLLTDNRDVSQSTIVAINALKKQGILVGLATGRGPRFLLHYMASLGIDVAIAYNGQYIFSREEVLFTNALEQDDVSAMITYANQHQKDLSLGTATGVTGSHIMTFGSGNLVYRLTRMIPTSWAGMVNFIFNRLIRWLKPQKSVDLQDLSEQPIYQMMLLVTERETKKLAGLFPQFSMTRSSPYAVDVISKGMSKLQGIRLVGEYYGFTEDEVMAFGDSTNDMEMIAGVQFSVAMGNANKRVKKVACYVTDTNNRDGIYKALQHFNLLEGEDDVSE